MKKTIFVTVILGLLATVLKAQNSLEGKIYDQGNRQGISGATVVIHELRLSTQSDTNGRYLFRHLPKGRFTIEISCLGYISKSVELTVDGAHKLDVPMETGITEMREVMVSAAPSTTFSNTNPIPGIALNKNALLSQASGNIIDAISRKPGVSQLSSGAAISKPVIRGLGYNRVLTLYNGVRQEGQQWGDEHGVEVDEYAIDKIEIIKGPGSLMYGSDAMAGVISLMSSQVVPEGKIQNSLTSNYQSNNGLIANSLHQAGNKNGWIWQVRLTHKQASNYRNAYDGWVYNSGFREWNGHASIGIYRKWGFSQLQFSSFNQTLAMPEGERDSLGNFVKAINDSVFEKVGETELKSYTLSVPYQQVSHQRLLFSQQFVFGRSRLAATFAWQLNQRKEFGNPQQSDAYSLYFYLPTFTYDVKFFLPEYKDWKTTIGINGMHQQNENKGNEYLIPAYTIFDNGGFVYTQKQFNRFFLSGGLRYDERMVQSEMLYLDSNGNKSPFGILHFMPIDTRFQNITFSCGASYIISKAISAKLNIARGFRAPNMAELASNGTHEGTLRYELGNTGLKAETSLQLDLGLEFHLGHADFEITAFSNSIDNYIYASRLTSAFGGDSIQDPLNPVPSYKYTQNTAQLYGLEMSFDLHPHPFDWLHFENSFSFVRARNQNQPDTSMYLPFIPAPRFQSELRANFKKAGTHMKNSYLKLDMDWYMEQNEVLLEANTETATPAYTLFHFGCGSDFITTKGKKLFSLFFSVNNLFDESYQSHLSRLKYAALNPLTGRQGIFNMGRNLSLKLFVPF